MEIINQYFITNKIYKKYDNPNLIPNYNMIRSYCFPSGLNVNGQNDQSNNLKLPIMNHMLCFLKSNKPMSSSVIQHS